MKKLMLYLTEEEYEKIRDGGFRGKISMSQWVRERLFGDLIGLKPVEDTVYVAKTPDNTVIKKTKFTPTVTPEHGQCKVCGMGLNEYGDYCIGKGRHKQ